VLAAVRSKEAAVKDQDDMPAALVTGELDLPSFAVRKLEIGRLFQLNYFDVAHVLTLLCKQAIEKVFENQDRRKLQTLNNMELSELLTNRFLLI
jgi:hypothetical protein